MFYEARVDVLAGRFWIAAKGRWFAIAYAMST